jgi:hypothetical protein
MSPNRNHPRCNLLVSGPAHSSDNIAGGDVMGDRHFAINALTFL